MIELYERILEQSELKGLSGKELGILLGLKKSPLTDWKNQKSNPTLEQILKLCEIFATSSDYLLFGQANELTTNELELLEHFRKLPEREQIKFIGRLEEATKNLDTERSSSTKIG